MKICPACQSYAFKPMFDMGTQPTSLVDLKDNARESELLPQHPIHLYICERCTHVCNIEFDQNAVVYSEVGCRMYNTGTGWQEHMDEVRCMVECEMAWMPDNSLLLEIGAGDCSFLDSVNLEVESGNVKLAVDPCEAILRAKEFDIQYRREYFDAEKHIPEGADTLVVMRHLLEHMTEPREFIEAIAQRSRSGNIKVFIEVPNCKNALKRCRIEDWTYEHPQHFTRRSLKALLIRAGYVDIVIEKGYGDEVLMATARSPGSPFQIKQFVDGVRDEYRKVALNIVRTGDWIRRNLGDIAFWGGAGKSAMFLRRFGVPESALVIDSHDAKWGLYVPGTGLVMRAPGALFTSNRPIVIATTSWRANDIRDEILSKKLPVETLYKFENGELVEVPLRGTN